MVPTRIALDVQADGLVADELVDDAIRLDDGGCGEPVELQLACAAGHVLESAREVTPVPGPGARKIA